MDKLPHPKRLDAQDWILAGFRALVRGGPGAVRVEPVARDLGATKGSFYWHFRDLAAWHQAMLAYWQARAATDIAADLAPLPKGEARLRALFVAAGGARDPADGGAAAEPALRGWAQHAPEVALAVNEVDAARLAWVAGALADMGLDPDAAPLIYAALLGYEALAALQPADPAQDRAGLNRLLDALLAQPGSARS